MPPPSTSRDAGPSPVPGHRRPFRRLLSLPGRIRRKMSEDRIFGMSAEAGFWGLVSLPSLLLAVFGALGYFGPVLGHSAVIRVHDDVLRGARDVLSPTTVNDDVAPIVQQILTEGHAGVVSVSFVISLWSGSSAMATYLNTITVAYGMRGVRGAVRSRLVALGLYLVAVVVGIVMLPALILGPDAIADLAPAGARSGVSAVVSAVYWPGIVVASVLVLATLYRLCLPVRVRWRAHLPGAVLAMLIWLGGSVGVRSYVAEKLHNNVSYGALGAPVAALLFFYVTALAVLLGAELNAALRSDLDAVDTDTAAPDHAAVEPAVDEPTPGHASEPATIEASLHRENGGIPPLPARE